MVVDGFAIKAKVKIISLPELGSVLEKKKVCSSVQKNMLHQKPRSQCGASCVVDGTNSVQVVIIRKSITTAATLQPLLIIRTSDNLVIRQSITRASTDRFFGLVVCFLLMALAAPIVPEIMLGRKITEI